jgi:hypothetical protein
MFKLYSFLNSEEECDAEGGVSASYSVGLVAATILPFDILYRTAG